MSEQVCTRVLVTGASGFLGRNIVAALHAMPGVRIIRAARNPARLPPMQGVEDRIGDLLDADYRRELVKGVDVICHAGTWASMWGHRQLEQARFYQPTLDLIEQAIDQGVSRFIFASTMVIGARERHGRPHAHDSATRKTGFWPHLDCLIDLDGYMRDNARRGMQMVTLRLGHFVGSGNRLGMLPALVPRLKTWLVPWLNGGRARMPLVADEDLGQAFALAATASNLGDYESFNIAGTGFPALREVIHYIAEQTGVPRPLYAVPYSLGYGFGWLMETLHPLLPGSSPFLTRSIVHLCEDWYCPNDYAAEKLSYQPQKTWQQAVDEHLADLQQAGFPWPRLCQP